MKVTINGAGLDIPGKSSVITLLDLLHTYDAKPPYAVALNGDFVPQESYSHTAVNAGDCVDVVSPVFGG